MGILITGYGSGHGSGYGFETQAQGLITDSE